MSIGCNFKAVVSVQIINLDSFDFVIGLNMIKAYKMELGKTDCLIETFGVLFLVATFLEKKNNWCPSF